MLNHDQKLLEQTYSQLNAESNAETIADVILDYCQGTAHLEFDAENLGEMVGDITALIARKVREDHNEHGGYVDDAISLIEDMK